MEKITDEMLELFGDAYQAFKLEMINAGHTNHYTFEQYVEKQMWIRKFQVERIKYHGKEKTET